MNHHRRYKIYSSIKYKILTTISIIIRWRRVIFKVKAEYGDFYGMIGRNPAVDLSG